MSEYDFVYEPYTPEELASQAQDKEVDNFNSAMEYEDMIILRKYALKHKGLFSKRFIKNIT